MGNFLGWVVLVPHSSVALKWPDENFNVLQRFFEKWGVLGPGSGIVGLDVGKIFDVGH